MKCNFLWFKRVNYFALEHEHFHFLGNRFWNFQHGSWLYFSYRRFWRLRSAKQAYHIDKKCSKIHIIHWAFWSCELIFRRTIFFKAYHMICWVWLLKFQWSPLCSAKTNILFYKGVLRYEIKRLLITPDSWVLKLVKRWFGHVKNTNGHSYSINAYRSFRIATIIQNY